MVFDQRKFERGSFYDPVSCLQPAHRVLPCPCLYSARICLPYRLLPFWSSQPERNLLSASRFHRRLDCHFLRLRLLLSTLFAPGVAPLGAIFENRQAGRRVIGRRGQVGQRLIKDRVSRTSRRGLLEDTCCGTSIVFSHSHLFRHANTESRKAFHFLNDTSFCLSTNINIH